MASADFITSPITVRLSRSVGEAYHFIDGFIFHTFSIKKIIVLEFPIQDAYPTGKVPLKNSKVDDVVQATIVHSKKKKIHVFFRIVYQMADHC